MKWWPFGRRASENSPAPAPLPIPPSSAAPVLVSENSPPPKPPAALLSRGFVAEVFPRADASAYAAALSAAMAAYHITSRFRIAHFLAQVGHESGGLTRLVEDLTYSTPGRICATWPRRFPLEADAQPFVRQPQALANRVYGGRLGNVFPNDGWRFRGHGLIQVTGRTNHERLAHALGWGEAEDAPARLSTPSGAALGSAWWWADAGLNEVADQGGGVMVEAVTRRVNGGLHGLAERRALFARVLNAMDAWQVG
jgi:putative chitinase